MYTLISNLGQIILSETGVLIAPVDNINDPDYQAFLTWQQNGGELTITDSPGENYEFIAGVWSLKLDYLKEQKLLDLSIAFDNEFNFGSFTCSLGFRVDNRRYGNKNDKDNIQGLIDLGITIFKDADGAFHNLTPTELITIKNEMIGDGLSKYQTKWYFEGLIQAAQDEETLNSIQIVF